MGWGSFGAAATPIPLLTSLLPFHTRSGSAWALEAFPGKPSYKRTAPASSPSPRQAPGDGYSESRCQDGLEPAVESRRARPAPATPGPAHRPPGSSPLRSLLRWHLVPVPELWRATPAKDRPGGATGQPDGDARPRDPPGAAQLTAAPAPA